MANNRSEKSKYPSKYSPKQWVTEAQYIVELVCEQAAIHTQTDLPLQFWKQEKWANFFKSQTKKINQLLEYYDGSVIIKVVKNKRIRTLLPKWVEVVIQKEQKVQDAIIARKEMENKNKSNQAVDSIINKPKTRKENFGAKIDKLLALDEEE